MNQIVEVIWDDACHHCGDLERSESFPLSRLKTIGYLVKIDKDGNLIVAQEVDTKNPNSFRYPHIIPKGMIVDWWYLDVTE